MVEPLETLKKMLTLEKRDYEFQDKAVAGGLVRYVGTWQKQALRAYGEEKSDWIAQVVQQMKAYSAAPLAERRKLWRKLWQLVAPETEEPSAPEKKATPAPEPPAPPESSEPEPSKQPQRGEGLGAATDLLPGVGEKYSALLAKLGRNNNRGAFDSLSAPL